MSQAIVIEKEQRPHPVSIYAMQLIIDELVAWGEASAPNTPKPANFWQRLISKGK